MDPHIQGNNAKTKHNNQSINCWCANLNRDGRYRKGLCGGTFSKDCSNLCCCIGRMPLSLQPLRHVGIKWGVFVLPNPQGNSQGQDITRPQIFQISVLGPAFWCLAFLQPLTSKVQDETKLDPFLETSVLCWNRGPVVKVVLLGPRRSTRRFGPL